MIRTENSYSKVLICCSLLSQNFNLLYGKYCIDISKRAELNTVEKHLRTKIDQNHVGYMIDFLYSADALLLISLYITCLV